MTRIPINGIELNVEVAGSGPAVMLLHGFTGDASTWEPFLDAWSGLTTIRIDVIGHGRSDSPLDASRYSMGHAVGDLLAVLDHLGIAQTALLGYSMGGRLALHFALAAPNRLSALVLESASPGIEDAPARAARVAADNALAGSIEREGLEVFAGRWEALPLFESQSRLPADVLEAQRWRRLAQSPLGLANSLRGMGAGMQAYLLPRLGELRLPSLFLGGALDERYTALARQMSTLVSGATCEIIVEAGHAAHLEQPERFAHLTGDFLTPHVAATREASIS